MKTPLPELRRARLPGALARARRAVAIAWRRSCKPALRGAPPAAESAAWAFVAWIAIVCVACVLCRLPR